MSKVKATVKHFGGGSKGGEARLHARPGEARLVVDLANEDDQPVAVDLEVASIPTLSLEVEDAHGHRVLLPPPPVLKGDRSAAWATIGPKEKREVELAGLPLPWWPSGEYRIRYRYKGHKDKDRDGHGQHGVRRAEEILGDWFTIVHQKEEPPIQETAPPQSPWEELEQGIHSFFDYLADYWRRATSDQEMPKAPKKCNMVASREVEIPMTQTITEATDPAWNGTYGWTSRFKVTVDQPNSRATITIRVTIAGTITDAQRTAWEQAIESKWTNRFKFCCGGGAHAGCCGGGYTFVFDIQYVTSGAHYVINAGTITTSMVNWGVNDPVDVTHEFGHMIGNKDEYFTVDGIPYGPGRQPDGNIMNNPANLPIARHYDRIRDTVISILSSGTTGTTRAMNESCA
jgi:hypothetical protein